MAGHAPDPGAAAFALLRNAHAALDRARDADDAGERFCVAHLSALRSAAVLLALRGRPATARRRLVSVWVLLDKVAPEYAEWSAYFAAGAPIRAAVEAGASSVLTQRIADDQLRSAGEFLALVESSLGMLAA
jgi:hypothetical protein